MRYAKKRERRVHVLKMAQSVELRVKLTQMLAINELLANSEDRLRSIRTGLTEIIEEELYENERI